LLAPARALLTKGNLPEAESATRLYLQNHGQSAEGHYLLGFILFREISAKWSEAGKVHGQISPYYGADASGAVAQFRDAKAKESLAEFTTGAKFHVPSAFDLKIVALDYILLKAYTDADQWLTQSLRRNSRDAQAWYYLGRTKYSESQFPEAIQAFVECLKLEPHNVEAETNVGLSYEGLTQRDQARQAFENAIAWEFEAAVKDPQPFIELGHLYLQQNDAERAVPPLLQATSISPNVSKAHEELGRAYSLLHRLPESEAEFEKAVALDPETAPLRCLLGQVYRRQGMVAQAQSEFERCTALQQPQPATSVKK
jgi:tetratricopeptide (TPR) repeat protein